MAKHIHPLIQKTLKKSSMIRVSKILLAAESGQNIDGSFKTQTQGDMSAEQAAVFKDRGEEIKPH